MFSRVEVLEEFAAVQKLWTWRGEFRGWDGLRFYRLRERDAKSKESTRKASRKWKAANRKNRKPSITTPSIRAQAKSLGVPYQTLYDRIKRQRLTPESALGTLRSPRKKSTTHPTTPPTQAGLSAFKSPST